MPRPWKTITSHYLLKRWWMNVREDHVLLPDGTELKEYHVLEMPDWVCVVCTTDTGQGRGPGIVLVRQFRHAVGRVMLELPAGAVDDGESVIDAGRRELLEETGYSADVVSVLPGLFADPSRLTNVGHIVLAEHAGCVAEPDPDVGEDLEVVVYPVVELPDLISSGELAHATHVAAILLASRFGHLTLE
jgi:8-oxo-dGTP pyrophosphatase MutT (NUDIX family)